MNLLKISDRHYFDFQTKPICLQQLTKNIIVKPMTYELTNQKTETSLLMTSQERGSPKDIMKQKIL